MIAFNSDIPNIYLKSKRKKTKHFTYQICIWRKSPLNWFRTKRFRQNNIRTLTTSFIKQNRIEKTSRRLLHGLLKMMKEVFTSPASTFCSAEHGHLGLDILEDTAIVDVMVSIAAFTDFKGTIPCTADGWWQCWTVFFGWLGHWHINNGYTGYHTALIWWQYEVHKVVCDILLLLIIIGLFFMPYYIYTYLSVSFWLNRVNKKRRAAH